MQATLTRHRSQCRAYWAYTILFGAPLVLHYWFPTPLVTMALTAWLLGTVFKVVAGIGAEFTAKEDDFDQIDLGIVDTFYGRHGDLCVVVSVLRGIGFGLCGHPVLAVLGLGSSVLGTALLASALHVYNKRKPVNNTTQEAYQARLRAIWKAGAIDADPIE